MKNVRLRQFGGFAYYKNHIYVLDVYKSIIGEVILPEGKDMFRSSKTLLQANRRVSEGDKVC